MGIFHNGASFDVAIFLEKTGDFTLGETRMNTGDKQVGARVTSSSLAILRVAIVG